MKLQLNRLIALVLLALLAGCSTATKKGGGAEVEDHSMGGGAGGDLGFDYAGEITGVDEVSGTLRLDQTQQLALIMRRINP